MSERETVDFLATVPLLEGREEADLVQLARVMRRRTVRAGEVLWRQGDDAREMVFVVDGAVSASLHVPGDRRVEIGERRPGGRRRRDRAARRRRAHDERARDGDGDGARARPARTSWRCSPAGIRRRSRSSAASRRSSTARLRNQLRHLAVSLGGGAPARRPRTRRAALADLEECRPPDSRYVRRMATFHDFDPLALWGFLTSGTLRPLPAGPRRCSPKGRRRPRTT